MVTRATRLRDLLDRLNINHTVTPSDGTSRGLRKAELKRLYAELDIPGHATGTVADLRDGIREYALETKNKNGSSRFSTGELRALGRTLETENEYLSAVDVLDVFGDSLPVVGDQITVNDTAYTVTGVDREDDAVSDAYDAYILVFLDDDYRLALFHENWDGDICRYRTSAAVEEQHRDPPYQRWRKAAYVTTVDVD
ncbi:hypothetical protein [Salinibaculum rarum]|uniref:hypothetical protein n=1 Tax=Salinibaculum rarum TaxID=3058903 RepID=UPI00265EB979|nr:hypothetical protein [Salinibaculum sp. KK48]